MTKLLKNNYKKIGILGGTFDPPHEGHLHIAKVALKKLKLHKILWIITKKNPLKRKPYLNKKKRISLSKKLIAKEKKIIIKYLDDKVNSVNTIDLINYIKRNEKKANLYFLIGADNLKNFHKWNNWEQIPRLAKIVVFPRKSYSFKSLSTTVSKKINKKDWIFINSKKINISSSLIRKFW